MYAKVNPRLHAEAKFIISNKYNRNESNRTVTSGRQQTASTISTTAINARKKNILDERSPKGSFAKLYMGNVARTKPASLYRANLNFTSKHQIVASSSNSI